MKISILEDDDEQAQLMMRWLDESNYMASRASTCQAFMKALPKESPDIVILDWELPDGTGLDLLSSLRRMNPDTPVLFTTQRDTEEDIVMALDKGADDYLIKPLRRHEFMARLKALSRRAGIDKNLTLISEGIFTIDTVTGRVTRNDEIINLTQKDYEVVVCLFENIGKALSRDYLLSHVWGVNAGIDTRTVDMHVSRVRRALKIGPENGYIIKTIYRYGYRLERIDNDQAESMI